MSTDLYNDRELADRLGGMEPTERIEPGIWTGFVRGTGQTARRAVLRSASGIDLLGAVGPIVQDTFTSGTEAQDRYFKEHDEVYGRAMEHLTPKPGEIGIAGQITGELLGTLPFLLLAPGPTIGAQAVGETEDLMRRGVPMPTAAAVGAVQALSMGLGISMPILGKTLTQRLLVGGAGFNVVQGTIERAASKEILSQYPSIAEGYAAFDPAYLTLDILLGLAFGGLAHVHPGMRAEGAKFQERFKDWLRNAPEGTTDALAVMRQAQHMAADSLPGRPVEPKDAEFHVERVRQAIEQTARNESVDVSNLPEPRTEPIPEVQAERAQNLQDLATQAEEVRQAEGLPPPPEQAPPRRLVPEDMTLVPPAEQARVLGQAVENRLLELRLDENQARANAAIWESFFETTSRKYGVRVDDLLQTYGIDVRRMSRADIEQLQPGVLTQGQAPSARAPKNTPEYVRRTVSSDNVDAEDQMHRGPTAAVEGGELIAYHLTDDSRYIREALTKGTSLIEGRGAAKYGDLGRGFYVSGIPRFWGGRSTGKWDFIKRLTPAERSKIADELEKDPTITGEHRGYLSDSELKRAKTYIARFREGKDQYAEMLANQPFNMNIARRDLLGPLGIEPGTPPKSVEIRLRGNFAELKRNITDAEAEALRALGYDGAFTPMSMGTTAQMVVWNNAAMRIAGESPLLFQSEARSQIVQTARAMQERWYSELERQITAANIKAAPAKGWKDYLRGLMGKGQVKADELKWTGIEEWLDLQGGRVTKEAVQDFLKKRGVRVEEVVAGGPDQGSPEWRALEDELRRLGYDLQYERDTNVNAEVVVGVRHAESGNSWDFHQGEGFARDMEDETPLPTRVRAIGERLSALEIAGDMVETKFGGADLVLPGGENYRELLLTLPPKSKTWQVFDPKDGVAVASFDTAVEAKADAEARGAAFDYGKRDAVDNPQQFSGGHFKEPNVLSWVRFNERTDADGKRVLFIEEIQSDWAQKGRKQGFMDPAARAEVEKRVRALGLDQPMTAISLRMLEDAGGDAALVADFDKHFNKQHLNIPTAPFVGKTEAWVALTLKRMIRWAAEEGFDRVAWTTGEQQVARYSNALRKRVDQIQWTKTEEGVQLVGYKRTGRQSDIAPGTNREAREALERNDNLGFDDTNQALHAIWMHDDWETRWEVDPEDRLALRSYRLARRDAMRTEARDKVVDTTEKQDALSDAIGKAMADQILNDPNQSGVIEGADITVSSTGMAGFYDRIVPKVAKEVLKQLKAGNLTKVGIETMDDKTAVRVRPAGDRQMPDMREMNDADSDTLGGAENFADGEPHMIAEAELTVDGRAQPALLILAPDGLHIQIQPRDGQADMVEFLVPRDRFPSRAFQSQNGALEAVDNAWAHGRLWDNTELIAGEPRAPEVSEQQGIEITPELRERALLGMSLFQGGERGMIKIGPETVIGLFEAADKSTFLHESSHLFLQITQDLARRSGAPLQALDDWSALSRWLGMEGGELTRAHQEKFATAFERYMAEGKAPSEELRSVFQQFRDWLLGIYKSLANIADELPDEIRGVMDRMLASERQDPTPKAEGPPRAEAEPPPPPGEATPAGRPEARSGADADWRERMRAEGLGEQERPPAPQLPLTDPKIASAIDMMLTNELGWEQIGGRRANLSISTTSGQPNFTTWIPKSEVWPGRPAKHLNEAGVRRAVEKARAREHLGKAEATTVDYLVEIANKRLADVEQLGAPEEWNATARNVADEGIEPSTQNVQDTDLVARAAEIDELGVERAAQKYENDDAAFMAEMRRIVGSRQERQAQPGERAPQGGQEGPGEAPGAEGQAQPDPLREAALAFVEADPERLIASGTDAQGNPVYKTLRQYLDDELLAAQDAREDMRLIEAAASCLYGRG